MDRVPAVDGTCGQWRSQLCDSYLLRYPDLVEPPTANNVNEDQVSPPVREVAGNPDQSLGVPLFDALACRPRALMNSHRSKPHLDILATDVNIVPSRQTRCHYGRAPATNLQAGAFPASERDYPPQNTTKVQNQTTPLASYELRFQNCDILLTSSLFQRRDAVSCISDRRHYGSYSQRRSRETE